MSKKALLIGFNYPSSGCPLSGCWNDVKHIRDFLIVNGYEEHNITLITDLPQATRDAPLSSQLAKATEETQDKMLLISSRTSKSKINAPTSHNQLMHQIVDFVETVKRGDKVFFHFSGHGGQRPDKNGDESDGMDECIYASDLTPIIDDDLRLALVDSMPPGVTVTIILDCCHSGTGIDLPFVKTHRGISTENYKPVDKRITVRCISACKDVQTAADTSFDRIPQGALTHAFIKAASVAKTSDTWTHILEAIISETKYFPQVAQLSSSSQEGFVETFVV